MYTHEQLEEALELVEDGMSQRSAAIVTGVPRSTLGDHIRALGDAKGFSDASTSRVWDQGKCEYSQKKREVCNDRVLIISDMHIPYHHKDLLPFLQHLKDKYKPTRVICMGDECDKHSLSYHDSDPDLPSAGDELQRCLPVIAELQKMFPVMDILESNHGSLVWRKAKTHGVPRHYIKSYNDVLGVSDNWQWHFDLTIDLPTGNKCYFHHGKSSDVNKLSQQMGMCAVQGHFHEGFKIDYWGNPNGLFWGLQTGCLIDDSSYAFSYNNVNIKRPVIGTALIIDGMPVLEPMVLDSQGDWIGGN